MQLLTSLQRIPAIFLLIQNYKTEGISHHPFGATILEIVQNTPEPFEKKMISDMIITSLRQQYSKMQVDVLYEREQGTFIIFEDRPQIKHIKQQFVMNLPQVNQQTQSEVKNVIRDFIDKQRQTQIPQQQVNLTTVKEAQINEEAYNVGFMRPMPKFIQVDPSEFHWFSPTLSPEVMWDSTSETNKKLSKGKVLLRKALDQHLTKDQCAEVEKALDSDPTAALSMEITTDMLASLIKQNPFLAVSYLVKLSNYPIISTYLDALFNCEVSVNSIDVASKLTKVAKVPNQFVTKYTNQIITKVLQMEEANKDRTKLARAVIGFIKNFKKNKLSGFEQFQQKLDKFLDQFIGIEQVQQFRKLMNKQ